LCVFIVGFFEEMAARLSMSTETALFDAVRERLGFRLALLPLGAMCLVNLLTLVAELAGMSLALQMATGVNCRVWALPCVLALWLILWKAKFSLIENGASLLGLFIIVFVWATWRLSPPLGRVATEMWRPDEHGLGWAAYLFIAVALVGAFVSPFQVLFYSSGAVEEKWGPGYRWANRIIAYGGNVFGGVVAACVIMVAAMVLFPAGVKPEKITDSSLGVAHVLATKGVWLFIAGLLFCAMAAGLQVSLSATYCVSEYFGWHWKKDEPPARSPLFHLVYMLFLALTLLIVVSGADPSAITQAAMLFNAVALPFVLFPLMLVSGDRRFAKPPLTSGRISIAVGWVLFAFLTVVAAAGIPLFIITGGGP
jgi:manganese transport protein